MLIDARSIPPNGTVHTDVCIVGAGPAGITIARELVDQNFRVTLLESGELRLRELTQGLYQGVNSGRPYYPLDTCRLRYLGGSTNYWGGWCRPLDAIDFEERDWVPHSGWPFGKQHLEHEYRRAQVVCKLGPFNYEVEQWKREQEPSLLSTHSDRFGDTMFQIGPTRFGEEYRATLRNAQNVHLMLNANVLEVEMDKCHQTVAHVRVATFAGNHFAVSASFFVLAAGGIENPRILLASRSARDCGVGNENDLVGRFFSDHLHVPIGVLRLRDAQVFQFYRMHEVKGVTLRGGMCLTEQLRRRERLLGFSITLHNADDPHDVLTFSQKHRSYGSLQFLLKSLRRGERPDRFGHHVASVLSGIDEAVTLSYRRFIKPPPRKLMIGGRAEQTPNRDSRVVLHDSKDYFGVPRVRLDWRLTEQDLRSLLRAKAILASELGRESVDMISFCGSADNAWDHMIAGGAHHMGTTRMHRDPKVGVVDENCRVHGTSNLYVAGSSVFPNSGWATPTLTIVALALRLADHLKQLLR